MCLRLIILFAFVGTPAFAQIQQAWVAKYNNGIANGNHQALKMALDSSGNIYVLGVSANANTNTGYVVVKYTPSGSQLWAARYDSTNFPTASPTGFALDSGNNVLVTGSAVTVKYDANGNLLWTEPYSGQAIVADPGQNIYITGASNNFTTIKLNPTGSNLWSQTRTYQGLPNLSQAMAVDSSSNVYVAGMEGVTVPRFNVQTDMWMIKYDMNGQQLWEVDSPGPEEYDVQVVGVLLGSFNNVYIEANYIGAPSLPYVTYVYNSNGVGGAIADNPTGSIASVACGIALDSQGNLLLTGGFAYTYPDQYSYATYKLDTNGGYVWTNFYPTTPVGNGTATSIAVDQGDNAYVTGFSTNATTGNDIVTIKYDSNGNQLWVRRYDGPGHGNDAGNAIEVDNAGSVYVAGYETETNGYTEMVLIKYSPVTIQRRSDGTILLQAQGLSGESFDVQASTNLQTWQDLGNVTADTNGVAQYDDTNAPAFDRRFYLIRE